LSDYEDIISYSKYIEGENNFVTRWSEVIIAETIFLSTGENVGAFNPPRDSTLPNIEPKLHNVGSRPKILNRG
jgi:hypothetical protein